MCGGELNIIDDNLTVCECEYCGAKQTIPKVDNEKKLSSMNELIVYAWQMNLIRLQQYMKE